MYKRKVNRTEDWIESFYRSYVRPIKCGKQGKKVEFGGKGALVHMAGFLFLDHIDHSAFAEENLMADHLLCYVERFGKLPPNVTADTKYGTLGNRELTEEHKVRASLKRRERPPKIVKAQDRWFKKKQRERNWI